jgi:uncharacterized protein (UPF0212 family)
MQLTGDFAAGGLKRLTLDFVTIDIGFYGCPDVSGKMAGSDEKDNRTLKKL